ncbi:MAG: PD-(D/E)XK nuclease family protein, partial [bacterium]
HFLTRLASELQLDPHGIEYSEVGAAANRRVFQAQGIDPDQVITGDFFDPALRAAHAGRFDVVTSYSLVEHFADPAGLIEPIHPIRAGEDPAVVLLDLELESDEQSADEIRSREGEAIAQTIHRLVDERYPVWDRTEETMRDARYGDIAVLYPGTTGIDYYEDPLRAEQIPYIVEGGKLYYTRQEVRDIAAALWAIEDPWDSLSLVAVLRSPIFGFSDEEIFLFVRAGGRLCYIHPDFPDEERFEDLRLAFALLADLHRARNERGPAKTLRIMLRETKYLELSALRPHGEQRVHNIRKAIREARLFESRLHSYRRFALWFRDQDTLGTAEGESPLVDQDEDAVRLLTIHKSKGLQFPIVILANLAQRWRASERVLVERGQRLAMKLQAGWETSNFTLLRKTDELKREAEIARLLYVAATRAGDLLIIPKTPKRRSYYEFIEAYLSSSDDGRIGTWLLSELPQPRGTERPFSRMPKVTDTGRARARAAREKWLAARREIIERASRAGPIVTPSGMEEIPARESWDDTGVWSLTARSAGEAASFGSAFHRIMELADLHGKGITELAASVAVDSGLSGKEEELADLVQRTLSSPLLKRAIRAKQLFREVPFTIPLDAGGDPGGETDKTCSFLEGRIDLLFEEEEGWTVVDYKTDDITGAAIDERFESYRKQGALYAAACDRIGIPLSGGVVFYFARPDETRVLAVTGETLALAQSLIGSAAP